MFENWLVVYLPLWKIWVRQLGWLFPIYGNKKNVPNHRQDIYIYFHFYTYSNFLSCFWTFYTYSVCLYIYVYDRVCSMLPGQKCWQDGIILFLGRPGTGHRHGLFPLKSLLSSKQVPQRLQYLLMAAWFPIWGCRGIIIICWMIIFQIVIIYQWKKMLINQWKNYGTNDSYHYGNYNHSAHGKTMEQMMINPVDFWWFSMVFLPLPGMAPSTVASGLLAQRLLNFWSVTLGSGHF